MAEPIDQRGSDAREGRLALAQLVAQSRHPHLIVMRRASHGVGYDADIGDSMSLEEVWRALEGFGPLSLRFGLRILLDALSGLAALHHLEQGGKPLGFVHGEVAPCNIIIGRDGIARLVPLVQAHWEEGVGPRADVMGYTAPERLVGDPADQRADVYSVGVLLWEAIMGSRLFPNLGAEAIITRLVGGRVPYPSPFSDAPWGVGLADVAMCALDADRDARWPHVGALGAQIENIAEDRLASAEEVAALIRGIAGRGSRASLSDAVTKPRMHTIEDVTVPRQYLPEEVSAVRDSLSDDETVRWNRPSSLSALAKPAGAQASSPVPKRSSRPPNVATLPGFAAPSDSQSPRESGDLSEEPFDELGQSWNSALIGRARRMPALRRWTIAGSALFLGLLVGVVVTQTLRGHKSASATRPAAAAQQVAPPAISAPPPMAPMVTDPVPPPESAPAQEAPIASSSAGLPARPPPPVATPPAKAPRPVVKPPPRPAAPPPKAKQDLFGI